METAAAGISARGPFSIAAVAGADPYAAAIGAVDDAFMGFYHEVRRNTRRIMRLMLALLPLMMLLVGSCKTSQVTNSFAGQTAVAQFRSALFPDRLAARDGSYRPASGYVARARDYIEGDPEALNHLTETEVNYLFGKPAMKRKDADARIWQYRAGGCVVDFFFYDQKDVANSSVIAHDGSAVSYVDFRLKQDLEPGSAARLEPVSAHSQSKCLAKIAG